MTQPTFSRLARAGLSSSIRQRKGEGNGWRRTRRSSTRCNIGCFFFYVCKTTPELKRRKWEQEKNRKVYMYEGRGKRSVCRERGKCEDCDGNRFSLWRNNLHDLIVTPATVVNGGSCRRKHGTYGLMQEWWCTFLFFLLSTSVVLFAVAFRISHLVSFPPAFVYLRYLITSSHSFPCGKWHLTGKCSIADCLHPNSCMKVAEGKTHKCQFSFIEYLKMWLKICSIY